MISSTYLSCILTPNTLERIVEDTYEVLKRHKNEFDAIAFRGMSGAMVAPQVAVKLKKSLLMVRKGEDCHSYSAVEGEFDIKSYVIVDDLVDTGKTIQTIINSIKSAITGPGRIKSEGKGPNCIGMVFYNDHPENYTREQTRWQKMQEYAEAKRQGKEVFVYALRKQ